MIRSMFSAVSSLKAHQTKMDVVANNIANVGTTGFKKSSIQFSDMMSQTIQTSAGPNGNIGGINGINIGLGTKVASQDTLFTQGALMMTGSSSDLAIQGEGFFTVTNGTEIFYTRNGNFGVDAEGNLVTAEGYKVLGNTGDGNMLQPLKVPLGETLAPTKTDQVMIGNNLNSSTEVGGSSNTSIEVFDNLGNSHIIKTEFKKTGDNEWDVTMSLDPGSQMVKDWLAANAPNYDNLSEADKKAKLEEANDALLTNRTSKLIFSSNGVVDVSATQVANGATGTAMAKPLQFNPPGSEAMSVDFDYSSMTQYSSSTTAAAKSQNGNPAGTIKSITFDANGNLYGMFTGGSSKMIGSLTIATFSNNEGLETVGGTMYKEANNSGVPVYGTANNNGNGAIAVGYLEASNVDLSEEITNMIVTQRGYSMQAKMITTSDEMLQELVNMKR